MHIFVGVEKINTEVWKVKKEHKIQIKLRFERVNQQCLLVVVKPWHWEHRMNVNFLLSVQLKPNPVVHIVLVLLVPVPAQFPVRAVVYARLVIIILEPAARTVIRCLLNYFGLHL